MWDLSVEIAVLAFFEDYVDDQVKRKQVFKLECEKSFDLGKIYIPSKEEISNSLCGDALLQLCIYQTYLFNLCFQKHPYMTSHQLRARLCFRG